MLYESGPLAKIPIFIVLLLHYSDRLFITTHFFVRLLLCVPSFLSFNQERQDTAQQWLRWTQAVNH